jgi:peptide/nickel transport system substrate-binding protein
MVRHLLFACLLAYAATACANRASAPQRSDLLIIASTIEPESLNPLYLQGRVYQDIDSLGYSGLTTYDRRGAVVADVAATVPTLANGGISRDGKRFVFHLRHDVKWSDGHPLTARDVVFSYRANMNPSSTTPSQSAGTAIAKVWAPDSYTVVARLTRPQAAFVTNFFGGDGGAILPAHLLAAYPNLNHAAFNGAPIGSGPYRFTKWIRGERLDLTANDRYFRGKPAIPHLSIRFVNDWSTIVNELTTHEVDATFWVSPSKVVDLRSIPNHRVVVSLMPFFGAIVFNLKDPIIKDLSIRRAFASAIDRRTLVAKAAFGLYNADTGMRGMFTWAFDPRAGTIAYDPSLARALLNRDGWALGPDGIRVKNGRRLEMQLVFSANAFVPDAIAPPMIEEARAVGIDLVIRQYDRRVLWAPDGPLYRGRFQTALLTLTNGLDPDPSVFLSCDQRPPNGYNFARYCNVAVDRVLRYGASIYDRAERRRIYSFVQRRLIADVPYDFLWQPSEIDVIPTALRGYEFSPGGGPYSFVAHWRLQP